MSTELSLTVGWVSNPRPLAELSCLGTGTDSESDIGGAGDRVLADAVVGASTPTILSEILKV